MIRLKNGCYFSGTPGDEAKAIKPTLSVIPANWKAKNCSVKKHWQIYYRFYDPAFENHPKFSKGKLVIVKKMNVYKDLLTRQEATQFLIDNEITELIDKGYNPITGLFADNEDDYIINPATGLTAALNEAMQRLDVSHNTRLDVKSVLNYFCQAVDYLRMKDMPVKDVQRRHILRILDVCGKIKDVWTANTYNYYISHLRMVFKELVRVEAIEVNPIKEIEKKKSIKKLREVLTNEQRTTIDRHLRNSYSTFWRFTNIFFHSGSRITEILSVQGKDVDLKRQRVKYLVKKGNEYREVYRTIKDIALPFWIEVMKHCKAEDYVFSENLEPGKTSIRREQITRRWNTHVKKKLKINVDYYSLKHLNSDETVALIGTKDAAAHNSHSEIMLLQHYAVGEKERQHERIRKIDNSFASR